MVRRDKQQYIRRLRPLPAALAVLLAALILLGLASVAWAGGDELSAPVARWPMVVGSLGLLLAGFSAMGFRRAWTEMNKIQRGGRIVGVALMALGIFGGLYGLTEVPPGGTAVEWVETYEEGRQIAEASDRPLVVDFTADWCAACQELDAEVFQHPEIRQRLETEFVPVKIDYDNQDADTAHAIERFRVSGLPRVAFETVEGDFLSGISFEGKIDVDDFDRRLDQALAGEDEEGMGWLEGLMHERGLLVLFLLVFGAGLLASLSPCVYPLIPITIGVLGAREATTRRQGFTLSLSYVGGIVVTYSALGIFAAIVGSVFGGFFQNIWVQVSIAAVFFLLALGCLGVYDFRMPGWLQKRAGMAGGKGHVGAFIMGLAAGVIAAPCIGPVVAGILVYVADQGDLLLGWSLLTAFAMGLGVLFLVLGTFSSLIHRLPRAGGWMEGVKALFGAIFLGLALYYLRLAVPLLGDLADSLWLLTG